MKLVIDIPQAFVTHYKKDKFNESLGRVLQDIKTYRRDHTFTLSGVYEEETVEMLIVALCKSKIKKEMCVKAYNQGFCDGVEYAEQNPPLRPNY